MSTAPVSSPRFLGLSPVACALLIIATATLLRLYYCTWLPLTGDEAYYYQWSKHLDASYFSKGPGVAYAIAAGTALFGGNNLGIRLVAVLLSAGTAWQMFALARRWYDETVALMAVLITSVVPLYALGAIVMTIDPISAFFWIWAANLFSRAIKEDRLVDWMLTGFAVGVGFLGKYLNALELVAFLAFLLLVPERRHLLFKRGFWVMLLLAVLSTGPVWWWNWQHHWISLDQLENRGKIHEPMHFSLHTFLEFFIEQAGVISPLLFIGLLMTAVTVFVGRLRKRTTVANEGELLLLVLFLPVFLLYAVLALHLRCEPNWPAISYLSVIVLMAARWKEALLERRGRGWIMATYLLAWVQTLIMHNTEVLPLKQKLDPMNRLAGWAEIAARLGEVQKEQHADILLASAYKEASILSFHIPGQPFIYALHNDPPANQFDFWPTYPTAAPHRALWITLTGESDPAVLAKSFNTVTPIEYLEFSFRGKVLRKYTIYLCENR